jgi:xanthine dehydrogenase accessory factor
MRLDLLKTLNAERAARRATILVTDLESGEQRLVKGAELAADPLAEHLDAALRMGKSRGIEESGKAYFLTVQAPPVRIICIGAVHISQALAPMARLTDFDVTIIDPRTAFATAERFPNVRLLAQWPQDVLGEVALDRYTAVCLLTHDPKIDDPALIAALKADCVYIGALGSRKTHAKRLEMTRLRAFMRRLALILAQSRRRKSLCRFWVRSSWRCARSRCARRSKREIWSRIAS